MGMLDDYLDPDRFNTEEPTDYAAAWKYLNQLYWGDMETRNEELIKRRVYKHTDCGAWIEFKEDGIKLGSIVEGSDYGADSIELSWKEIPAKFTDSLDVIEYQCDLIWEWANQPRDDGKTDRETGLDWPLL